VAREVQEETGLKVRVLELIEAVDRIVTDPVPESAAPSSGPARARYHYVILDYLCEQVEGRLQAGGDVTEVVFARETELPAYALSPETLRVLRQGFAMARARGAG
jgi:ADP-ribose pyrophosphatase YjhB (NUDIX family)